MVSIALAGWVPDELSGNNEAEPLHILTELLQRNGQAPFLKIVTKKDPFRLPHDNARPHVERRVIELIANKGWKLLPYPPYSPTEAPINYHVNHSNLRHWYELVTDVKAFVLQMDRVGD